MKYAVAVSLALQIASVLGADCPANGNNCARAVTGTFQGLQSSKRADCVAFQRCTVTPVTSTATSTISATAVTITATDTTVTVTVSATSTSTVVLPARKRALEHERDVLPLAAHAESKRGANADLSLPCNARQQQRRDVSPLPVTSCPTSVPNYASACTAGSPSSAYASACSCAGVMKAYTTVATPIALTSTTVTPTVTVTATTTVTASSSSTPTPPSAFVIQVGPNPGMYAVLSTVSRGDGSANRDNVLGVVTSATIPRRDVFQIVAGILRVNGAAVVVTKPGSQSYIYLGAPGTGTAENVNTRLGEYDPVVGLYKIRNFVSVSEYYSGTSVVTPNGGASYLVMDKSGSAVPQLYAIPM